MEDSCIKPIAVKNDFLTNINYARTNGWPLEHKFREDSHFWAFLNLCLQNLQTVVTEFLQIIYTHVLAYEMKYPMLLQLFPIFVKVLGLFYPI